MGLLSVIKGHGPTAALRDSLSRPVLAVRIIVGLGQPTRRSPCLLPSWAKCEHNSLLGMACVTIEAEHFFAATAEGWSESPPAPLQMVNDRGCQPAGLDEGDLGFSAHGTGTSFFG